MPRLYRVIVPVRDLASAERFYATVLRESGERVSPGRHYFDLGNTILALYDPVADGDPPGTQWIFHENQYLYVAVPDLEPCRDRVLASGGTITDEIAAMPWGERLFYARDLEGTPLCFVDETTLFLGSD